MRKGGREKLGKCGPETQYFPPSFKSNQRDQKDVASPNSVVTEYMCVLQIQRNLNIY